VIPDAELGKRSNRLKIKVTADKENNTPKAVKSKPTKGKALAKKDTNNSSLTGTKEQISDDAAKKLTKTRSSSRLKPSEIENIATEVNNPKSAKKTEALPRKITRTTSRSKLKSQEVSKDGSDETPKIVKNKLTRTSSRSKFKSQPFGSVISSDKSSHISPVVSSEIDKFKSDRKKHLVSLSPAKSKTEESQISGKKSNVENNFEEVPHNNDTKISKKRKITIPENVVDSPAKKVKISDNFMRKPNSPKPKISPKKKRYTSIASTLTKTGVVTQKNAPRKTLCNMDILGLLDDDDEENDTDEELKKDENNPATNNKDDFEEIDEEDEISFKDQSPMPSLVSKGTKVPIWAKPNTSKSKANKSNNTHEADVFDVDFYGEEEWGPDKKVAKKKTKRKKKETKGILVFNKNVSNLVRNAVKESHNLMTPGTKKTKPKRTNAKRKKAIEIENLPPLVLESPEKPKIVVSHFESDVSHGAQNYFDSEIYHAQENPEQEQNRSGIFGNSLEIPSKTYKTPLVPKKLSRLHDNSSTPNKGPLTTTSQLSVKELISNNFGFDSEEDDLSESENTSLAISPVRKVCNPIMAIASANDTVNSSGQFQLPAPSAAPSHRSRVSTAPIISKTNQKPFRINFPLKTAIMEHKLLAKVKAIRQTESDRRRKENKLKSKRVTPRKVAKGPIHCSTLLEDIGSTKNQPSVYEMLKNAKSDKKATEDASLSESEVSSLYDEVPSQDDISFATDNQDNEEEITTREVKDKENEVSVASPKKVLKPAVSRVYKRKQPVNNTTVGSKSGMVSFDRSSKLPSPKKETKKDKELKAWAEHQTSHFSEVDDFDLSFN